MTGGSLQSLQRVSVCGVVSWGGHCRLCMHGVINSLHGMFIHCICVPYTVDLFGQ